MRQRNIGWRLDYLLASQSVFDRVRSCTIHRDFGTSDHAPVVAEFAIGSVTQEIRSSATQETKRSGLLF
jgi:exodeoxyribonuclease-3